MSRYIDAEKLERDLGQIRRSIEARYGPCDNPYAAGVEYAERLVRGMDQADVVPTPKWINVKERLPKESTNARDRVLVEVCNAFNAGDIIDTDRIYDGRWVRWGNSVTHWMLLPEPPKEEE